MSIIGFNLHCCFSHIRSKIHGREPAELIHIPNSLQETLTMKYYQFYKITWKLLYINSSLLSPCVQNDDASSSPVLKRRVVISSRARMQPTAISNSGHFRISQVLLILILNQSPNKPYLLVFHQFRCSTERPSTKIEATHLVPKAPKYPGLQFFSYNAVNAIYVASRYRIWKKIKPICSAECHHPKKICQ